MLPLNSPRLESEHAVARPTFSTGLQAEPCRVDAATGAHQTPAGARRSIALRLGIVAHFVFVYEKMRPVKTGSALAQSAEERSQAPELVQPATTIPPGSGGVRVLGIRRPNRTAPPRTSTGRPIVHRRYRDLEPSIVPNNHSRSCYADEPIGQHVIKAVDSLDGLSV